MMLEEKTIQKLNELIRRKTDEANSVEEMNALAELVTAVNVSPLPDNSPVIGFLVPVDEGGEGE
jgi:hypothetical protein